MSRNKITAAELMAKLNADPKYVRMREDAEKLRQHREAGLQAAELPLLEELRSAGYDVASVWDFVSTPDPYPDAVPILLSHISSRSYPDSIREGIARSLAVPEAKVGWKSIVNMYRTETEARVKDGLAVAIAAIADDEVIDEVILLVTDTNNAQSRLLLLSALERSADPRAYHALSALRNDPELHKEIKVILRRMEKKRRNRTG